MNAKKLPSGSWRCRAYDSKTGKTKSFTASTKKEAEFMANEWLTGRKQVPLVDKTLSACIDDYLELKSELLSVSTADKYRRTKNNQLSAAFLDMKLSEIDSLAAQKEINRLSGKYAPKTVCTAFGLVSAVIHTFFPERRLAVTLPKIQKRTRELPSAEEVYAVFHGYREMELVVLLGMWLGLRQSEIRGLKKSDFYGGVLQISRTIVTVHGQFIEQDRTKTIESRRGLSVPPIIQSMVDDLDSEYITTLSGQAIYKRFVRRMNKAGFYNVTFHDLRHINASVMLQLGIPDKYAMERGGWSTTSTLKRIYQETFSTERQKVDKKIDGYFQKLATKLDTPKDKCDNKAV